VATRSGSGSFTPSRSRANSLDVRY
jgi:hypothetical protein